MPNPLHINIAEPCHENWQQMTPNEQGRHCASCAKTVVDFTFMSDQEILNYFSTASTSVCGRFHNNQLNKSYTAQKAKPALPVHYAWKMFVTTFLLTGSVTIAQTNEKPKNKTAGKSEWKLELPDLKLDERWTVLTLTPKQSESFTTLGFATTVPENASEIMAFDIITPTGQDRLTDPRLKIFGGIKDGKTGKPIRGATIRIKGLEKGIDGDENGRFEFPIINISGQVILEMSADGYETQEYTVQVNSFNSREFYLDREAMDPPVEEENTTITGIVIKDYEILPPSPDAATDTAFIETITQGGVSIAVLDTIAVAEVDSIGEPVTESCSGIVKIGTVESFGNALEMGILPPVDTAKDELLLPAGKSDDTLALADCDNIVVGGITVTEKVSTTDKITREIKEWLPTKKDLRVYPNPVIPGTPVNISLNVDKTGEYKLQLMDASGRIIHVQALQVQQKTQVAQIPTQSSWAHGVYWVRISNAADKKVYQAKLLLQ